MNNRRWSSAQISEAKCWRNIEQKLSSCEYTEKKKEYWNRIFLKIKNKIKLDESKAFLDFGCGPSGIILIYPDKSNLTCLDPLINKYIKMNPLLLKTKATFVNGKIEEYLGKKFDYVFGFNSLDHVDSIKKSLKSLRKILKNNGKLVISVNCHNLPIIQSIMMKTSFIFDKPHPHQYTLNQYCEILRSEGFKIESNINIDNELDFMSNKKSQNFNLKSFIRKIAYPFSPLYLFGYDQYGKEDRKSVYSSYIIIASLE